MKSANEKKMEAYNQMCVRLGLQPSSECEAFCGVVSGYDVVVSVPDRRYPCNFTVVTSAEGTMLLDKAMSKEIVKMHKAVKTAKQTGRQIQITMQCRGYKDIVDAVYEAVNGLVSYLSSHGFAPCCSNCGQHKQTADYLVGAGSVVQLCPECANNYGSRMALDNQQNAMKKDNVVAGVVGAGRTEMAQTIFGMDKVLGGKVYLDGNDITGLSTQKVMKAGVNYVSEDRHADGIFKISSVAYNITSGVLSESFMGKVFLNQKKEKSLTQQYIDDFRIKVTGQEQEVGSLSGGNQQKVVIGHALATNPKLIILDEPTRGIDAGARTDVYNIIKGLSKKGLAVLLISSDMEEIIELSDRAVTIHQGRLNCEFDRADINQENLTKASFGVIGKEKES